VKITRRLGRGRPDDEGDLVDHTLPHIRIVGNEAGVPHPVADELQGDLGQGVVDLPCLFSIQCHIDEHVNGVRRIVELHDLHETVGIRQRGRLWPGDHDSLVGEPDEIQRNATDAGRRVDQEIVNPRPKDTQLLEQDLEGFRRDVGELLDPSTSRDDQEIVRSTQDDLLETLGPGEDVPKVILRRSAEQNRQTGEPEVAVENRDALPAPSEQKRGVERQNRSSDATLAAGKGDRATPGRRSPKQIVHRDLQFSVHGSLLFPWVVSEADYQYRLSAKCRCYS